MKRKFPYEFICIEGNIGAGKTTLCNLFKRDFGCRLILEEFDDNPFLPNFYKNKEQYAFPVELFFMTERHKQLQANLSQNELFSTGIVSDYFFLKTLLFAKNNLNAEEYRLFKRIFKIMDTTFPNPDLIVYLHRPVDSLLKNIRKRGRDYENKINEAYLLSIQQSYFDFFEKQTEIPHVIVDIENLDFENDPTHYQIILDRIEQGYKDRLGDAGQIGG